MTACHRRAFERVAAVLPFAMFGVDSHNDSAFMSESVFDYCKGHDLVQTRSHAYKKNDQTWVEQKNGSIVREASANAGAKPGCTRHTNRVKGNHDCVKYPD
jgi:hypothetical protein